MNLNFFKDVDTESFWLTCWSLCGIVLVIVVSIVNYNIHLEDQEVAKLIREGHDPLQLACVYNSAQNDMCETLANIRLQKMILDTRNGKIESGK